MKKNLIYINVFFIVFCSCKSDIIENMNDEPKESIYPQSTIDSLFLQEDYIPKDFVDTIQDKFDSINPIIFNQKK